MMKDDKLIIRFSNINDYKYTSETLKDMNIAVERYKSRAEIEDESNFGHIPEIGLLILGTPASLVALVVLSKKWKFSSDIKFKKRNSDGSEVDLNLTHTIETEPTKVLASLLKLFGVDEVGADELLENVEKEIEENE